jgi:phosphonate transport system permease protein
VSEGAIRFGGTDLARLQGRALRRHRAQVGMIYQQFNLVKRLRVIHNVLVGRLPHLTGLGWWGALTGRFPRREREIAFRCLITISIALWGTLLAVVIAVPLGFLGARNLAPHPLVCLAARRVMDVLRAVNEFVFALMFVTAVGLGPFAGMLALGIHTGGVLGKLLSETVEAIDAGQVEGVAATGASRLHVVALGVVPQILPNFISYLLLRFESDIRSASVIGTVGGGGIGFYLWDTIRAFNDREAATVILMIVAMVMLIDVVSSRVRRLTI